MKNIRKRIASWLVLAIVLVCLAPLVFANEEVKVTGMVAVAPDDPEGKLAPLVIQSEKEIIALVKNAVAQKIAKKIGKKVDVTGTIAEVGGKKILTPWLFMEAGAKPKEQPAG